MSLWTAGNKWRHERSVHAAAAGVGYAGYRVLTVKMLSAHLEEYVADVLVDPWQVTGARAQQACRRCGGLPVPDIKF